MRLLLLALFLALGCQHTLIKADGTIRTTSFGDVKIAICDSYTDGAESAENLEGCLVIEEGGITEFGMESLTAFFNAALAVLGRALP